MLKTNKKDNKTNEQRKLLNTICKFYDIKKKKLMISLMILELASEARYKRNKETKGKRIKTLSPEQMLHRLPKALAQVKASNISDNWLNEIKQIVYSLYRANNIIKNVYDNIIKSIKYNIHGL